MPTDHRFGRDDDERLFPFAPKSASGQPEELIDKRQAWPRMPTFQDGELLPEGEILQHKFATAMKNANEDSKPEGEKVEHGSEL
jgi:hypothetical protein